MKKITRSVYRAVVPFAPIRWLAPKKYVIISGCPRSGTSACLAWLDSHSDTATFYENRIAYALSGFQAAVNRYQKLTDRSATLVPGIRELFLRDAADQKYIRNRVLVLKEPVQATAYEHVDQLAMLQDLRSVLQPLTILLMVRHPLPVVNSIRKRTWGGSITGQTPSELSLERAVGTWKNAARMSIELQDSPDVMSVRFEDFQHSPQQTATRIADRLGLNGTFDVDLRPVAELALSDEQQEYVLEQTRAERETLGYGDEAPTC